MKSIIVSQEQASSSQSDHRSQGGLRSSSDVASTEDEESSSSTQVRGEEAVLEHKADDPRHPANNRLNNSVHQNIQLSSSSSTRSSEFELAMVQLKQRCVGSVQVLRADLQSFRNNNQQSVFRAPGGNTRPTERLSCFLQVCDHQRRLSLFVGALSLLFLLPVYLLLSFSYNTHNSSSYAWIISAAYDEGTLPSVVLLSLWFVIFVWMYRAIDPELRYRGHGAAMRKWIQRLYRVRAFWQEYTLIATALLINALIMLVINGIYVFLVVRNGRTVSAGLQILLATFKLLYNGRFISKLIRGSEWLQALLRRGIPASALNDADNDILNPSNRIGGESLLADDESYGGDDGLIPGIYSEAILVVFNFIVVPIIAASPVASTRRLLRHRHYKPLLQHLLLPHIFSHETFRE